MMSWIKPKLQDYSKLWNQETKIKKKIANKFKNDDSNNYLSTNLIIIFKFLSFIF